MADFTFIIESIVVNSCFVVCKLTKRSNTIGPGISFKMPYTKSFNTPNLSPSQKCFYGWMDGWMDGWIDGNEGAKSLTNSTSG